MAIYRYGPLGPLGNNTYLIVDEATKDAALVDPSFGSEKLLPEFEKLGVTIRYILLTHAHFDHIVGNPFFLEKTGAPIALHPDDATVFSFQPEVAKMYGYELETPPPPTMTLEDGQTISLGETAIRVLHTPGHSPGGVSFLVGDEVIGGDCLFEGAVGITNIPSGNHEQLIESIRTKLLTLPDATKVLPGHGRATTVGHERATNPFLNE